MRPAVDSRARLTGLTCPPTRVDYSSALEDEAPLAKVFPLVDAQAGVVGT